MPTKHMRCPPEVRLLPVGHSDEPREARWQAFDREWLGDLRSGISVEMAIRLSKAFGSTPETWLRMQMAYDLREARSHIDDIEVARFYAA